MTKLFSTFGEGRGVRRRRRVKGTNEQEKDKGEREVYPCDVNNLQTRTHPLLKNSIRASQASAEGSIANNRRTNLKPSALTKKQRTLDRWTWIIRYTGINPFVLNGWAFMWQQAPHSPNTLDQQPCPLNSASTLLAVVPLCLEADSSPLQQDWAANKTTSTLSTNNGIQYLLFVLPSQALSLFVLSWVNFAIG